MKEIMYYREKNKTGIGYCVTKSALILTDILQQYSFSAAIRFTPLIVFK